MIEHGGRRGVPTKPGLFREFASFQVLARQQGIGQGRFAHPGLPREHAGLPFERFLQRHEAFPSSCADRMAGITHLTVVGHFAFKRRSLSNPVNFVDDDREINAAMSGCGGVLIDQQPVRFRLRRDHDHDLVKVCRYRSDFSGMRRTCQHTFSGEDTLDSTLSFPGFDEQNPIAYADGSDLTARLAEPDATV